MEVYNMKKFLGIGGLVLMLSMSLIGCSSPSEPGGGGGGGDPSEPEIDYGQVAFKSIYLYADNSTTFFDGVYVQPTFTYPDRCQDEVFQYEVKNEDICYVEDDHVYAFGVTGTTKVTATSQHLRGTFYVTVSNKYFNAQAYATAKSLANKAAKATNKGTTLFLGDSFFEFWRNKTGIDENFATAFAGYDVANVGISGTQAREWRSFRNKLIDPYEPENIVMNIGINDVDDNGEDGVGTAGYIMQLCKEIWAHHPNCQIYYCSITRCSGFFANKWPQHEESNSIMKANAENEPRLHYLDIMERYGSDYASYEQDGFHPNTAGYAIFKDIIKANVPLKTL